VKVIVFTSKPSLIGKLKNLEKTSLFEFRISDPKELKKTITEAEGDTLVYLDTSAFTESQITRTLKSSQEQQLFRLGVLDETGSVDDPGNLIHLGAVDYLSKKTVQQGITASRLNKALSFCGFKEREEAEQAKPDSNWKLSGTSWKNVKSGQEYTFCFMFIEIDLIDEWKNKSGRRHLDEVKAAFQKHVQEFADSLSGKIWMWMDLGGLILFPFNGKTCEAILGGIRLVLSKPIISAEKYPYHTTISYRLALHIGNTTYRARGHTGTIISDTVNYLFHLGHKFAKPGNFYLTEPVARYIPESLRECFIPADSFEGLAISRMRLPVDPARRPVRQTARQ
jgi:hypothetical protein